MFAGLVLLVVLGLFGSTVPTPFVAIGRGPTYDTLGVVAGTPVVAIADLPTYPTSGQLNMTTVGVTSGITTAQALGMWIAGDRQVVPRSAVVPPGESQEEAMARNAELFTDSQSAAEGAAISYLGLPVAVYVGDVVPGSAATGVLEADDVILEIAGRPVTTIAGLRAIMATTRPGQQVPVLLRRGADDPREVQVTLGRLPETEQGALGILPAARPVDEGDIVISLADVGGPSAGLVFALAVIDKLTPGELTGGRLVAGTGTIASTGEVGPIQGIRFKMLAAREAGATVFLVPGGNCDEARSAVPEGLQTARVDDLSSAVAALDLVRAGVTPPSC